MPSTSRRLEYFSESVIRKMTRIANAYGAVNLSQGFPDFQPPKPLLQALEDAAMKGPHQYAITWGAQNFREALAKKQSRFMGMPIDPEREIVVTCGSTESMMCAMMTVCNPGDRVIVFSPFYENYGADAILSGAEPIFVPLHPPNFSFDEEELQFIAELADQYDVFIITDEVYEHIVYKPYKHTYFASLPGMFERTISCSSLSKTYSITGWRLGYLIATPAIIDGARKVHDFLTVGAPAPLQEAAVTALGFPDEYYESLGDMYTEKRDFFIKGLDEEGLTYTFPQGAYYVMMDISEFECSDDTAFCEWMAKEVGVAAVPGSSFFREDVRHLVRFHFAKKKETLEDALQKLSTLRSKAKKGIP